MIDFSPLDLNNFMKISTDGRVVVVDNQEWSCLEFLKRSKILQVIVTLRVEQILCTS